MTAGEVRAAAHSLPFRPVREMLEDRPFIIVAPHPDDESLACGGLIAHACARGLRAKVVIVTDGAGSHPNSKAYPPDRLSALREDEAKQEGAEPGLRQEDTVPQTAQRDRHRSRYSRLRLTGPRHLPSVRLRPRSAQSICAAGGPSRCPVQ
jgi:LmbE family N-acetylglucosaminyl deacetylase